MMLRKWLWRYAAIGLATAAGGIATLYYAAHHPDSYLGQCFRAAEGEMAGQALLSLDGTSGPAEMVLPKDPVPVADAELLTDLLYQVAEGVALPPTPPITSSTPIVVEPTPVDEEEGSADAIVAELLRPQDESSPPASLEDVPPRPRIMPYAEDDDRPVTPMPFAEADEETVPHTADALLGLLRNCWTGWWGKGDNASGESALPGFNELFRCPYPGCLYPSYPVAMPQPMRPTTITAGGEEFKESKRRQLTPRIQNKLRELIPGCRDCDQGPDLPRHSLIDTMEFRRSDRTLNELAPGGPY